MRFLSWLVGAGLALGCARVSFAAVPGPPPLEAYAKLPALELVRISPDGDKIAFVAVDGETRRLFVRKIGGDAILVRTVGEAKVRDMDWAGEDFLLVSISATIKSGLIDRWSYSSRYEYSGIVTLDLNTKQDRELFFGKEQTIISLGGPFVPRQVEGRWYDFVDALTIGLGRQIYRVDLETGKYAPIPDQQLGACGCIFDDQGRVAAREFYDGDLQTWRLYAGDRGRAEVTSRRSPLDRVGLDGWGRSAGTVLVREESPRDTIDEYPVQPGARPIRLFDSGDVESLLHDPQTNLLVGAVLTRDRGFLVFDPVLQKHLDAVRQAFSKYRVRLISFAAGMKKIVIATDGADDSGTYWIVDMTTGKADELMTAYPSIDAKAVAPSSVFAYRAADGLGLEGVLTTPPGVVAKGLPLVVIPHGGPIGAYDEPGFHYWAQAFASRGYAVFQPNYRGSGGYGAALREAGFGQWGDKMLTDVADGVRALAASGMVDPRRVCIAGASYGGYAALAGVTIQHGLYRCAVSVSGVSDAGAIMSAEGDGSATVSGRYNRALFGASFSGAPMLRAISPLLHAEDADAPILLVHGKDDTVVPFVHSLGMNAALQKAGKTVEFLPLEGEDHWWSRELTRIQILKASVAFVEKYNPAS